MINLALPVALTNFTHICDMVAKFSIAHFRKIVRDKSSLKPLLLSAWYRKSVIIGLKPFIAFSEPYFSPFEPFFVVAFYQPFVSPFEPFNRRCP